MPDIRRHPFTQPQWFVIHAYHAKKAIAAGVDGIIAVSGGAGGHAGTQSAFSLVREIREFWSGMLVLGGVLLSRVALSASAMELAVAPETTGDCEFTFIGTGGRELARSRGRTARYPIAGLTSGYVRAVVRDSAGHRAWVQPVRFCWRPRQMKYS